MVFMEFQYANERFYFVGTDRVKMFRDAELMARRKASSQQEITEREVRRLGFKEGDLEGGISAAQGGCESFFLGTRR